MNKPNDENSMPANNVKGETFEEHDIYMNVLLKSLNIADKDGRTEDPFIFVEKNVERYPMYDKTIHWRLRKPKVGEKYVSVAQYKDYLTYYALANGFSLWYESSGEAMVVAKCGQRKPRFSDPEKGKQRKQTRYPSGSSDELLTCPWRCYDRWMSDEKTFQCISLEDEHTCVRNFNFGSLVNYKWISKIFSDKIRANPDIRLCDIANLVMIKYKFKVRPNQCTNAKNYALTEYENTIGSMCVLLGLADGWMAGCRKIIALDGCFLKRPNQGEILSVIGRDGNNHIYPVAWAVVNVENKYNWTWFLELLKQDLGSNRGNGLTLMFDQHKGLMEAVKDVIPNAEHMQCARHIYENFRKQYSRAFFKVDIGCEAIENRLSECFNSVIVNVRHKPLLTMLEDIRVIVLERMNKVREISRKWNPGVCPNIKKRLEWLKEQQRSGSEGFTVDEGKRTCSCRMWQLSGIPWASGSRGGASGSRGGSSGSRGRGGAKGSRGGASGSRGGASI
ncbi:multidrug resistance-associated protein 5, partial [Tanacetum coccineum]